MKGVWQEIGLGNSLLGISITNNIHPFEIIPESYTQFRIKENYRYIFKLNDKQKIIAPQFDDSKNCNWRILDEGIYECPFKVS